MSASKEYGEGFIHADDLTKDGRYIELKITISDVSKPHTIQAANKKMIPKWVLSFKGTEKKYALPKTVFTILRMSFGEPENWTGKQVTLYPAYGRTPLGDGPFIRIRAGGQLSEDDIPVRVRPFMGRDITGNVFNPELIPAASE